MADAPRTPEAAVEPGAPGPDRSDHRLAYDLSLDMAVGPARAAAAWTDPAGFPLWQTGFLSRSQVAGEPYAPGSRAQLVFAYGSRPMTMHEEVLQSHLTPAPGEAAVLACRYISGGYVNVARDEFAPAEGGTRWRAHHEWDLSALELEEPPSPEDLERFRATTLASMQAFKTYVEGLG